MEKGYQADPTSLIGGEAQIGEGTRIWQFCNIMDGSVIGENCNIGQNVFVESGVRIGNRVKIKNNVALYRGVVCEDDVFLGPNCVFTNVINPRSFIERKQEFRETVVQKGATIGANATIVCGHTIGRYAMVGAGTVVTHDVGDYRLVVGNPGKTVGYVCTCGVKLLETDAVWNCPACGRKYCETADGFAEER
ncbi:MAG: N-acetyltransferase [Bacteroidales bacterium]|nr:N-acetyltransferase [Bacteroidales bacterium]MCM1414537.1 N-acetyltransferase [bacterium]MCM1422587.1 N-acetyltransferase [bacterium]